MAAEAHTNRYKAFLSYSQSDNSNPGEQWGDWLHQQLERYEIPPSLVGTPNRFGDPVSENLYPIFRDRASLPSGGNLSEGIQSALRSSDCLVVICTPASARSDWVRKEIREFKNLGRGDRIVAVVVAGRFERIPALEGAGDADDCFAPELRSGIPGADGVVDWSKAAEPIAADLRPKDSSLAGVTPDAFESRLMQRGVDERTASQEAERYRGQVRQELLRVVAGILGVQIDVLARRDLEWQAESERRKAEERRSLLTQASQNAHAAAERHFRNGRWEDGIASLGRALRFDPDNPEPGWHLWSAVLWGEGDREPLPEQAWRLPSPCVSLAVHPITGTVYVLGLEGDVFWQSGGGSEWKSFRAWNHPKWKPTFRSDDFIRMAFDEEGRFLIITTEYAMSEVFTYNSDGEITKEKFVGGIISNPAWSSGYFVWRNHAGGLVIRRPETGSPHNTVLALANEELILSIAQSKPVVVTYDESRHVVHVYDFLEAQETAQWQTEGTPYAGVLSPDGNELLLHDRIDSWSWRNTVTGQEVANRLNVPNRHTEPVFSASGDRFAIPDTSGHIVVWDRFARAPTQLPRFTGEWPSYILVGKTEAEQAFWGLADASTVIRSNRFRQRAAQPTAFKLCFQSMDRSPLRTGEFRYFADGSLRATQGDGSLGPSLGHTYFQVLGRQLLFSPDGQSIAIRNPQYPLPEELDKLKTTVPDLPSPHELERAVVVSSPEPTTRPTTEWQPPQFSHPADPTLKVCEYGGRVRVVHSENPRPVAEPFSGEAAEFTLPGWLPNGNALIAQYLAGETQDPKRGRDKFQEIRPLRFVPWPQSAAKGEWVKWLVETLSGWDIATGEERRLSYADRQERCNQLIGALESADAAIRPPEDWSRLIRWWRSGGQDWNLMSPVPDVPVNIRLRPSSAARPSGSPDRTREGRSGAEVAASPAVRRSAPSSLRHAIQRSRHRQSLMRALSGSAVAAWAGYWAALLRWSNGALGHADFSGALKSLAVILSLLAPRFALRFFSRWRMKRILHHLFVAKPGDRPGLDRSVETLYRRNLSDPRILHMFASYLDWTDRNDVALERLMEQVDLVEDDRNLLIQTAWAAACSGSIEAGHEWLSKATVKAGDDPCLADTKAWLSYREGNYQRAWATLRPVLKLSSVHPEMAYHAGMILKALNHKEHAIEFFRAALRHPQPFAGKDHARTILGAG